MFPAKESKRFYFWIVLLLLAAGGFYLRARGIDLRPLHNDEGVNFHFLLSIFRDGYFPYSHENYHGPSYFYLSTLCTAALGFGEFGVRSAAVLSGMLLLTALLPLRRTDGDATVLTAALLCALSSSLVFYARYAIHESLFVLCSACLGVVLYAWARTFKRRYIFLGGAALGVLIATKETFIITLFCVGLALLCAFEPRRLLRGFWRARTDASLALLICALLVALLFSGGLQWAGGVREMFFAVPQWISRNQSDTGHFKPFAYYADMLLRPPAGSLLAGQWQSLGLELDFLKKIEGGAESELWLAVLLPLLYAAAFPLRAAGGFFARKNALLRFAGVWTLSAFAVYGLVDYKTPWLVINITFPAILFLSAALARLYSYRPYGRFIGGAATALTAALALQNSWKYNFEIPYGNQNPYSYVHTRRGMLDLVRDMEHYREKHPDARVLVGVQGYWPLPYYLRDWEGNTGYLTTRDPESQAGSYQILILDKDVSWKNPKWAGKYYRLSDVQESRVYFMRDKAG